MDKDLKDAVLAAFGEQEQDDTPKAEPAEVTPVAGDEVKGDTDSKRVGPASEGVGAKNRSERVQSGRRGTASIPATRSRPGPGKGVRDEGAGTSTGIPAARRVSSTDAGRGATPAGGSGKGGTGLLVVSLLMLLLVIALVIQVAVLQKQMSSQKARLDKLAVDLTNGLTEVRNYSRLHLTTYAEQGKRPQRVISVVEIKDGKPKIVATEVRPLEEP